MAWQIKKLGKICTVIAGQSPNGRFYNKTGNGVPFYQGKKEFGEKFIGKPTTWTTEITKMALNGDILMSVRAPVGPTNITTQEICIGRGLAAIRCREEIDREYLFNFLRLYESEIIGNTGAVFNSINKKQIENLEIPLPPIPEQHRIVKILDEVFEKTAKAKENAEKNLKNAKELFESYLQSVFAVSKYEYKDLGSVCKVIGGGTPSKEGSNFLKYYNGTIPWATVRDMKNELILETEHKITEEAVKESSTNIIPKNNVLIATRVGLGKVCLIKCDTAINQDLRGIVPLNNAELSVEYLFWWFKSISKMIIANGTGATVHGVKLPFIKGLKIPVPSLKEQEIILVKFKKLSAETKKLESIYQHKLTALEELKKSILKKAFAGEL